METHHQADLELSTGEDKSERHDRSLTHSPNHTDDKTIGWVMGTRMEEEEEEEDGEEEEEEESHVQRRLYGLSDEHQRISLVLSYGHGLDDETDVDLLETSDAAHTLRKSEVVSDSVKDDGKDASVNLRAQERGNAGKLSSSLASDSAPVKPPPRKKSPARPRDNPPPVNVGAYEPMWEANSQRDKLSVHESSVKTQEPSAHRGSVLADDDQQPSTSLSKVTASTSRTRTKSGSSQNEAHDIELSSPMAVSTGQRDGEVTTMTNHRRESGGVEEEEEEVGEHSESLSQSLSNGAQSLKPYTDFVDIQRLLSDQNSWDQKKEDPSDVILRSIFSGSPATANTKQLKKLLRLGTWHPGATLRNKAWQWLCVYRMHKLESSAFYKNSVHEIFPGRCVCVT
jgi:hypothetical protein